jgi:hypothetical protein
MSLFKVLLEGHCFAGKIDDQQMLIGFYTTVGIVATTRQEFAHALEEALDAAIKENGLRALRRSFRKSFCRVSEVYLVDSQISFANLGGMTFFHESELEMVYSNLVRIFLSAFKPRDIVKGRP